MSTIFSTNFLRLYSSLTKCRASEAIRTAVPGLSIWKNYLSSNDQDQLLINLCKFREGVLVHSQNAKLMKGRTYLSKQHNLGSSEDYKLVHIAKQTFQYFDQYGGEGHSLTYAIGNKNIPEFVKIDLISRILQLPEMKKYKGARLEWNFTFNTYSVNNSNQLSGFPRHKDIPENGDVTFIYSLGTSSEFEIEDPEQNKIYRYPLLANSLLQMSDEARWDFLHAVVPQKIQGSPAVLRKDAKHTEHRYSAVLGFHVK